MLCNGSITACGAVGVSSILTFRFGESNERSEYDSLQLVKVGVTDTLSNVSSVTFRFFRTPQRVFEPVRRFEQERTKISVKNERSEFDYFNQPQRKLKGVKIK